MVVKSYLYFPQESANLKDPTAPVYSDINIHLSFHDKSDTTVSIFPHKFHWLIDESLFLRSTKPPDILPFIWEVSH